MRKKHKKTFSRSITGVLSQVSKDQGWEKKLDMHSVFMNWENLVGETIAKCASPCKIVKNVLWVEVDNSSWMQQLQFDKVALLDKLNSSLRFSRFADIKFLLPSKPDEIKKRKGQTLRFISPDSNELADFERQVSSITDEKSREALIRLWYLSKACIRE